jgi:hypothetical protein
MDFRTKAEQDIISAADCWARGVLQTDRLLDLIEQNLLDAILVYDKLLKRSGLDPSHLPPPPQIPHDMNVEDQIPTVRYSEHTIKPSPPYGIPAVKPSEESPPDSSDIF